MSELQMIIIFIIFCVVENIYNISGSKYTDIGMYFNEPVLFACRCEWMSGWYR